MMFRASTALLEKNRTTAADQAGSRALRGPRSFGFGYPPEAGKITPLEAAPAPHGAGPLRPLIGG